MGDGNIMALIQVLAIGRKDCTAAVKSSEGCNLNPKRGSSSDPLQTTIHGPESLSSSFHLLKQANEKKNSFLLTMFIAERNKRKHKQGE